MTDKERDRRVQQAQMRVLFNVPFFAPGVAKLGTKFVDASSGIDTAATDGKDILWCREFIDKMDDKCIPTILCHEVCHAMLGHLWRAPVGCDWDQWNRATDHAVNLMLKEFSEQIMAKRLADPFPFPDPQDAYCADPAYKGMAEEVIYGKLPKQPSGKGGKPGKGGGAGKPGKGSMPSFGQMIKPQPGSAQQQGQQKQLANQWGNTLQQSLMAAKGRGDIPGGMERMVDGLVNPRVPWFELVRQWLAEKAEDDWNWSKPNLYMDETGFILPTLDNERIGEIVFSTDTSGSIDNEVLKQFQSEKQGCLDDVRPSKLVDIYCDSAIHKVKEYARGDSIERDAPGGGGTDFRPVFDLVGKRESPPKCLVYLTDLDGTFPDADPGYPVLWVIYGRDGASAPFGEVIHA